MPRPSDTCLWRVRLESGYAMNPTNHPWTLAQSAPVTLKDQVQALIAEMQETMRRNPSRYRGDDWDRLLDEEIEILEIDPERFPHMLTAWCCYETLLGIVDAEAFGFDAALIEEERKRRPQLKPLVVDFMEFRALAKEIAGLSNREANAIFYKIEFWQVRNGLIRFADEKD